MLRPLEGNGKLPQQPRKAAERVPPAWAPGGPSLSPAEADPVTRIWAPGVY